MKPCNKTKLIFLSWSMKTRIPRTNWIFLGYFLIVQEDERKMGKNDVYNFNVKFNIPA